MFSKLAVRNIPNHIFSALENLAISHDRSTEAEARHAIRSWVEPALYSHERNARCASIAERLGRLLEQLNEASSTQVKPSHIALAIGEPKAKDVEDWFLGLEEPTFMQLQAIANAYGVQFNWLAHGDSSIYKVESASLSGNIFDAVDWLLSWDEASDNSSANISHLYFVREMSESGYLAIVKRSNLGRYKIYTTNYQISENIGNTGEADLINLFLIWQLLYRRYTNNIGQIRLIESFLIHPQEYDLLVRGNLCPDSLLKNKDAKWWEDIWDEKMQTNHEYWPGWTSLYRRINNSIQRSEGALSKSLKIASGEMDNSDKFSRVWMGVGEALKTPFPKLE